MAANLAASASNIGTVDLSWTNASGFTDNMFTEIWVSTDSNANNYNPLANTEDGSCCMGTGSDQDELVASLVAAVSQGAVIVNGCADGLPTLNGLLGVECSTDMSVFTTELPAGTTAGDLCGCSCPDPEPVSTCEDDTDCNFGEEADCAYELGCGCGNPAAAEGYD